MGYKVNEHDIAYSLNGRWAMYKGEPVVLRAEDSGTGYCPRRGNYGYILKAFRVGKNVSKDKFRVDILEPTFSCSIVQGGYCFNKDGSNVAYLSINNGQYQESFEAPDFFDLNEHSESIHDHNSQEFYDCLMGIHPTFKEAAERMKDKENRACSFHRDFALVRASGFSDVEVHHKNKMIGLFDPSKEKITLRKGPTTLLLKRKLDKLMQV